MILFKGVLKAQSPFMIGSGVDMNTDSDVILDPAGFPFIPGTTLAGVCRHYLGEKGVHVSNLFGDQTEEIDEKSKIIFYDSYTIPVDPASSDPAKFPVRRTRDAVQLKDRVAVPESKFNYEIVESGAAFQVRIQLDADNFDIFKQIVCGVNTGDIRIGSKTTRGYGAFVFENPMALQLDCSKKEDLEKFIHLDSNWSIIDLEAKKESNTRLEKFEYQEPNGMTQESEKEKEKALFETITVNLELKSFLFLRDYATTAKDENNDKFVDAQTLLNAREKPVIPGTAWAGVFRAACTRILAKIGGDLAIINNSFGYVDKRSNTKQKSKIIFTESVVEENYTFINRTRTAIDRVSGSALQTGALFTGRIACRSDNAACKLILEIKIQRNCPEFELVKSLIHTCIADLKSGYLAVGGDAAIGAGIFKECGEVQNG